MDEIVEVDCATGQRARQPLTAAETAQRVNDDAETAAQRQAQQKADADRESHARQSRQRRGGARGPAQAGAGRATGDFDPRR
jgi:hypothetical protein